MPFHIPAHKNLLNPPGQTATVRMSDVRAFSIIEDMDEANDERELIDAHQHIVNMRADSSVGPEVQIRIQYMLEHDLIHPIND